ncbi:MAG: lipopolysaccharide biosynthesis protein [Anaeromyxobacteraceae bacterium]
MNRRSARLARLARSAGARHGMMVGGAMLVAGMLDYAVSVVAGRWLGPTGFGVFVSVTAILQVLLGVATAIRIVVAHYGAAITAHPGGAGELGAFLRAVRSWCWRRGLAATAIAVVVSPLLVRPLRLSTAWPLWAASGMVLMLFLREAALGALQGVQAFDGLGLVQVCQALLRITLAAALIALGAGASGAILAQPLAAAGALALGARWLRPYLGARAEASGRRVSWAYSASTVVGLTMLGVLTNLDALVVKMSFSPAVAGDYGPVVTFARISFFVPCGLSFVLLPKATQRGATGRDARPLVLLSLAAVLAPGLALSLGYLLAPGAIVRHVFTGAYADPGVVLGLASLAATLHAGVNIWLTYALAVGRPQFVYALAGLVLVQAVLMFAAAGRGLTAMVLTMVAGGVVGNVGGWLTTCARRAEEGREAAAALPRAIEQGG